MRHEEFEIPVEGQVSGAVKLHSYILDAVSVDPEKKRTAVIVCPGGGYRMR